MRLDKLAITAQEAFQNSMGVASDAESAVIQPIHLLKALLDADENNLAAIIKRIGADPKRERRGRARPEVAGRHAHADAGQ